MGQTTATRAALSLRARNHPTVLSCLLNITSQAKSLGGNPQSFDLATHVVRYLDTEELRDLPAAGKPVPEGLNGIIDEMSRVLKPFGYKEEQRFDRTNGRAQAVVVYKSRTGLKAFYVMPK